MRCGFTTRKDFTAFGKYPNMGPSAFKLSHHRRSEAKLPPACESLAYHAWSGYGGQTAASLGTKEVEVEEAATTDDEGVLETAFVVTSSFRSRAEAGRTLSMRGSRPNAYIVIASVQPCVM